MKRILTTILAASMMLLGTSAFAQISVGAGYVNSSLKTSVGGTSTNSQPANGFYVGGDYLISEGGAFGISVGAYYSYLTSTASTGFSIGSLQIGASSKVEEMYLDIPVNFNLGAELASGIRAFAFAGPTFDFGLSSTTQLGGSIGGKSGSTGKSDNYANSNYGRFDILVGGGVGVDYNKIRVKVGYNFGMLNKVDSDSITQNRNVLTAGIALLF